MVLIYLCSEINKKKNIKMNYTVVGLFPNKEFTKEISEGIEQSGIKNEDYIIYKTNKNSSKEENRNFWKKLLGDKTPKTEVETLITSVSVRNEEELNNIKKSFEKNDVVKIYEFKDMTLEEAKNLDYVKKVVALRAKSHIYAMPQISVSRGGMSEGINTEVKS
jgi:ribosome-binding ATPase YchF (GTP1/OBG family)